MDDSKNCDTNFQEPATPVMEGSISFPNDLLGVMCLVIAFVAYFLFLFVVVYYYVCKPKEAKDRLQPNDVFLRLGTIQASILKSLKFKLWVVFLIIIKIKYPRG